jgi:hypothetical protein
MEQVELNNYGGQICYNQLRAVKINGKIWWAELIEGEDFHLVRRQRQRMFKGSGIRVYRKTISASEFVELKKIELKKKESK